LRRFSEYFGGPQIDKNLRHQDVSVEPNQHQKRTERSNTHRSAAVSNVLNPAPTTNILPQNPPKLCFTPLGQNSKHPTHNTHRPQTKVIRKPYLRSIQPEMVSGHKKYAPKQAAERPDDSALEILSNETKLLFSTSRRPYAKRQRKKRHVTD
jgi:hypothetical protein